ncbi:sensor domain-containing phosphodiesterase [Glaciimonas immobilis]|uniref:Diguanylate cyclase (GGDEF)-like protein/PAS domain S-box-containing protein n=1 Tax=Glaciimonas immobilis TaxID=728004 RepID=A0A840RPM2_9BURK|nr:EAL domain-containing protein [Glaciimonas immobilis]KAF3999138.1 EAL domain-containing protein [Glaciimonas immobilis]MBB5198580.1 diguanylate cyclase (GGDEF)-like protein/PAS domain S-box-containing protein [Glaciimonas immobilis]
MAWPLAVSAALLVGLAAFSMDILSSVRGFVVGESIYSKAQNAAVGHLLQYIDTRDPAQFKAYSDAIAIPQGDRTARLELEKAMPDMAVVYQAFLQGENHPDDYNGMVSLFRNFRHFYLMAPVISFWAEADSLVKALDAEAQLLQKETIAGAYDAMSSQLARARIKAINLPMHELESNFSAGLGEASRKIQHLLLLGIVLMGALLIAVGSIISRSILSKIKRVHHALSISEERLHLAIQSTGDGLWDWDIEANSMHCSSRLMALLEQVDDGALYSSRHFFQYIHPHDQEGVRGAIKNHLHDNASFDLEFRILSLSGNLRWVRLRARSTLNSLGNATRMTGAIVDVTERKKADRELTRSNRALKMLSRCSEAVIRAESERELLSQICRLAVDIGGYRMAWVGYAQFDLRRTITIESYAGIDNDAAFLSKLKISWSEDDPFGCGPAGRAVRSGLPIVIEDMSHDQRIAPWLLETQLHGYLSGIYLPLHDKDGILGVLTLYSEEIMVVSTDEINLLKELARDLAFGIKSIRAQQHQHQIQSAVLKIAAGVSASTGQDFFEQVARNMAEALGASAGFVARLMPGKPVVARVLAGVSDGVVTENFDYMIHDAQVEEVLAADKFLVSNEVAMDFSQSPFLTGLGTQAAIGWRLDNSAGHAIGLLFILFRAPLEKLDFITSTLQIFAARVASELEREETDARMRDQASLLDKAQDAIIVRGMDHRILFWNKSAERLYGWTQAEVLGVPMEDFISDSTLIFEDAKNKIMDSGEWSGEITKRCKSGDTLTVESRWTLVRDDDGQPHSIFAIDTDITQRKASELEIQQLAFYDQLTLLPNRLLLISRLEHALATHIRGQSSGALLFIDLDNFKSINDTLGHDKGDLLLQQAASRITTCVRTSDTVARLGGDEFVVMLLGLDADPGAAVSQAKAIGEKILSMLSKPYHIAGIERHGTASIGITQFSDQQDTVGDLLKQADLAMYQGKASGRNAMRFFDVEMQAVVTNRAAMENDLRRALPRQEFVLYFQPQMDEDSLVTGAEGLLRWDHPERGLVQPAEFISLAEETGLILPLGQWVLETACAQLAIWGKQPATARLTLAVNVSIRQFRHANFVDMLIGALDSSGANPRRLKLEITESLMVDNMDATIAKMTALKNCGVCFSLDDFGTGYSSLYYLKRLPLDQLKIDQSFVKDIITNPNDAAIARTIVALAQSLGFAVIAEGVETEAQRDFLARNGCHAYQGYLFSKPLLVADFDQFFQAHHLQTDHQKTLENL